LECIAQLIAEEMLPEDAALMNDTLYILLEQWQNHEGGVKGATQELVELLDDHDTGGINQSQFFDFVSSMGADVGGSDDEQFTFSSFDKDGDGKLSRAELTDLMRDMTGDEPTEEDIDGMRWPCTV